MKTNLQQIISGFRGFSNEYQDKYYLQKNIKSFFPEIADKTIYKIIEKSFINSKGKNKLFIKELAGQIRNLQKFKKDL